jgi:hypothetical protein
MRAADGGVRVLTADGSLVQIDGAGKVVKQEAVPPADIQKTAEGLRTAPDTAAVKAAQKQAPPGRIVKLVAAHDGLTAVAYWGGTVQVLRGGDVHTSQLLPQDVAGLVWLDDKLIVGLADGQVVALTAK